MRKSKAATVSPTTAAITITLDARLLARLEEVYGAVFQGCFHGDLPHTDPAVRAAFLLERDLAELESQMAAARPTITGNVIPFAR